MGAVCRTPHGVRGLKFQGAYSLLDLSIGRTPHGVRGLKYFVIVFQRIRQQSHPSRGAWIEIAVYTVSASISAVAPLTGCVD